MTDQPSPEMVSAAAKFYDRYFREKQFAMLAVFAQMAVEEAFRYFRGCGPTKVEREIIADRLNNK